jgi:hypothetical protein
MLHTTLGLVAVKKLRLLDMTRKAVLIGLRLRDADVVSTGLLVVASRVRVLLGDCEADGEIVEKGGCEADTVGLILAKAECVPSETVSTFMVRTLRDRVCALVIVRVSFDGEMLWRCAALTVSVMGSSRVKVATRVSVAEPLRLRDADVVSTVLLVVALGEYECMPETVSDHCEKLEVVALLGDSVRTVQVRSVTESLDGMPLCDELVESVASGGCASRDDEKENSADGEWMEFDFETSFERLPVVREVDANSIVALVEDEQEGRSCEPLNVSEIADAEFWVVGLSDSDCGGLLTVESSEVENVHKLSFNDCGHR